ncbi:helix-turn-helix domain-containing protein [Enterococcus faecalis]|uniref:helix-turn-helix domain-containing protein n=1 Tax=Enterococcus faecalis TaxID=1351 RepID=UPI0040434C3A
MNNNEKIRDIIVARRKELGISLSEMARRLNIPKSTLSRYENLKHQYPLDEIQNFSSVLDLDPKYILGLNQISSIDELYNQLEPERQKIVYDTAKEQLAQQNKASNNVVNINKKKYDTLAAHSPDLDKVFTDEEKLKINQFLDKVDADYDRKQKECKHLFDDESDDKE